MVDYINFTYVSLNKMVELTKENAKKKFWWSDRGEEFDVIPPKETATLESKQTVEKPGSNLEKKRTTLIEGIMEEVYGEPVDIFPGKPREKTKKRKNKKRDTPDFRKSFYGRGSAPPLKSRNPPGLDKVPDKKKEILDKLSLADMEESLVEYEGDKEK